MCVIIFQGPKSGKLSKPLLELAWNENPHGAGLMYHKRGKLQILKSLDFEEFRSMYDFAVKDKRMSDPLCLHFRWATHGHKNLDNCHPFVAGDQLGLVHNGVLPIKVPKTSEVSDTYIFAKYLRDNPYVLKTKAGIKQMEQYITAYNKIVLMSPDSFNILNESSGAWWDNNWYSNFNFIK